MTESIPELNFVYDWTVLGTIQGINAHLRAHNPDSYGLNFQGEGWYRGEEDVLLVVAENDKWRIFGWHGRDPRGIFQQLLALENIDVG